MPRREVKFPGGGMAYCKKNNNNVKHKRGEGVKDHTGCHAKEGSQVSWGVDGVLEEEEQQCEAQEGRGSERSRRLSCQGGKLSFLG